MAVYNRNTNKFKINHNDLLNINAGNINHLSDEQMLNLLNKDEKEFLLDNNKIIKNNIPYSGLIYGNNDGYIVIDDNDGFMLKNPNSNKIFRITNNIVNPYDLTTKEYVDNEINKMLNVLINVCKDNNILQEQLKNYYNTIINFDNLHLTTKNYVDISISSLTELMTKIIKYNTELQLKISEYNLDKLNDN